MAVGVTNKKMESNKPDGWEVKLKHGGVHPHNQSKGINMKQTRLLKIFAAGLAGALALGTAGAQTSSTTTTTSRGGVVQSTTTTDTLNGTGTITAYTPDTDYITFRSEASAAPVRYYYTKKTVLVDPQGRAVAWSALRPDTPVSYQYVREGDHLVVTRVVVQRPVIERETTTTTTTTEKH